MSADPRCLDDATTGSVDAEIILAMCRRAIAQLRLEIFFIEEAATLLKAGRVSLAGALAMLQDEGVDRIVLGDPWREVA